MRHIQIFITQILLYRIMSLESKLAKATSNPDQRGNKSVSGTATTISGEEDGEVETAAQVLPLPLEVIERNRRTVAEIRALPRFKDYTPGEPNKVCTLSLAAYYAWIVELYAAQNTIH